MDMQEMQKQADTEDQRKLALEKGLKKYKQWRESEFHKKLCDNAEENLGYITGSNQGWDDSGDRAKLEAEKRPALTNNRVAPIFRLICGSRPQIESKFAAVSDDDVTKAPILNACKVHIDDYNSWDHQSDEVFKHGAALNRAAVYLYPNYDTNVQGEVGKKFINGLNIVLDPNSRTRDYSDTECMFVEDWPLLEELIRDYPEHEQRLNEIKNWSSEGGSKSRSGSEADEYTDPMANWWNQVEGRAKVVTWWYKEYQKVTRIINNETGDSQDVEGRKADAEKQYQQQVQSGQISVFELKFVTVKYMIFTGEDLILEEGITPWERPDGRPTLLSRNFPVVVFETDRIYTRYKSELINSIDNLKDPQKYYNKLVSNILAILGTQSNSGWIREEGTLDAANEEKLKKFGSTPGVEIVVKKNALVENRIHKIEPSAPPQGQMAEARVIAEDLLNISGVESLVSTQSLGKDASGYAIEQKQAQGGNIISWIYDSYRAFNHRLARFEIDAIQRLYDYEKVIRIRGQKPQYIKINEPVYDEQGEIVEVLNDVTVGDYDVTIADKEITPSMRIERFKYFSEMVKSGQIILPPEVLNKVMFALMDDPELKQIVEEELSSFVAQQQQQMQQPVMPEAALTR